MEQLRYSIPFKCSLTEIVEKNPSFDGAKLRIAYHGDSRKKTRISKEVFEAAIPSLYYIPIVCNYSIEEDSIGSHDMQIIERDGRLLLLNMTHPVGVVPENANVWWEEVTEDSGVTHEYMCADVLLWKRQPAYAHIKENGITDHSMEINIKAHEKTEDGFINVLDFDFEALCLLESEPPCFESAELETLTFSASQLKSDLMEMIQDFKNEFSITSSAAAEKVISFSKGGETCMNLDDILAKYGLTVETIGFDITGMSEEEIENKLKASEPQPEAEPVQEQFSLNIFQMTEEFDKAFDSAEKIVSRWGDLYRRYNLIDFNADAHEVYVNDAKDKDIKCMSYTVSGDALTVDFTSAKRVKVAFVPFEGSAEDVDPIVQFSEKETKFAMDHLESELNELREFKASVENAKRTEQVEAVFAAFSDLAGDEMFESLRTSYGDMAVEQIEEKCFAIRGRRTNVSAKFSMTGSTRIPVVQPTADDENDPYHGVFRRYGII